MDEEDDGGGKKVSAAASAASAPNPPLFGIKSGRAENGKLCAKAKMLLLLAMEAAANGVLVHEK